MTMYKYVNNNNSIVTDGQGKYIPVDSYHYAKVVQKWIDLGNTIEPFENTEEVSKRVKRDKIQEIRAVGRDRIEAIDPSYDNFDTILTILKSIKNASLTTKASTAKDILEYANDKVTWVKTVATSEEIAMYNPKIDTNWPS